MPWAFSFQKADEKLNWADTLIPRRIWSSYNLLQAIKDASDLGLFALGMVFG